MVATRKIKLVIDCRMINKSGIGRYIKNILSGFVQNDKYDITCLGYEEINNFSWSSSVKKVILKSKILSGLEQIELFRAIPSCDVFWSPNWNVPLMPIKAKQRLVTIHDVYHLANPHQYSKLSLLIIKAFMFFIAVFYRRIITVSNFSESEIVKYTPIAKEKIEVVRLGIEETFDRVNHDFSIKDKYILFVGNVKSHKNLKLALAAFKDIDEQDVKFYIVGDRDGFITKDETINSLVSTLENRVVFTGVVSDNDLKNYYYHASLFLFPSLYEGFGLPILEAMKFGLPILASNAASIPEVAGNMVTYFEPTNHSNLLNALNTFFSTNKANLRLDYRAYMEQFKWSTTVHRHSKIIESLGKANRKIK